MLDVIGTSWPTVHEPKPRLCWDCPVLAGKLGHYA
jgi:hypothetical protein